ncbi:MAG: prolipoprotein diacylglyceryl transferase family protein [Actinomycetota bacterium]
MIDVGLLLSMVAAIGVPTLAQRFWPIGTNDASFADLAALPALAGLIVGRLVAVAFESPSAFGRVGDLLIIRSGVDFWPGALTAVLIIGVEARRRGVGAVERLAALAPLALLGYAAYEACCLFRDGCFGPVAPLGLRPPGVATAMVPVGLGVAIVVAALAVVLRSRQERGATATEIVLGAVAGVALTRAVASIWLPHVGQGLTRPHRTSIVVAALAVVALIGWVARQRASDAASITS